MGELGGHDRPDEPSEPGEEPEEPSSRAHDDDDDALGTEARRYHAKREQASTSDDVARPDDETREPVRDPLAELGGVFGDPAMDDPVRVGHVGLDRHRDAWDTAMKTGDELLTDLDTRMIERWGFNLWGHEPT
jgi:hypothetical protein